MFAVALFCGGGRRGRRGLAVATALCACVTLAPGCRRVAAPPAVAAAQRATLLPRLRARAAAPPSFTAEVRLTYFAAGRRLRGTAVLAVRAPDHLRYDVEGPHGGVVSAFACDGAELQALDVGRNDLVGGSATAAHFDALLPMAPLHLDAAGWVGLLTGAFAVPAEAAVEAAAADGRARLRWRAGPDVEVEALVDVARAEICALSVALAGRPAARAELGDRDAQGLPQRLRLHDLAGDAELTLQLRDVTYGPPEADSFQLAAPRGASVRRLAD